MPKMMVYGLFVVSSEAVAVKENGTQLTGSMRED